MSVLNPQIWVGQGNKYSEAPPKVRHAAAATVSIPASVYPKLLHNGTLCGLTSMPMPSIQPSSIITTEFCKEFFSDNTPSPMTSETLTCLHFLSLHHLKSSIFFTPSSDRPGPMGQDLYDTCILHLLIVAKLMWRTFLYMSSVTGRSWPRWRMHMGIGSSQVTLFWNISTPKDAQDWTCCTSCMGVQGCLPWNQSMNILDNHDEVHTPYPLLGDTWLSSSKSMIRSAFLLRKHLISEEGQQISAMRTASSAISWLMNTRHGRRSCMDLHG